MSQYLGGGPGEVEYELGDPRKFVRADPRICVTYSLVKAATAPGGYLDCFTDRAEPGGLFRILFDDRMLVYQIVGLVNGQYLMQWPD